jgi:hypothetical protein
MVVYSLARQARRTTIAVVLVGAMAPAVGCAPAGGGPSQPPDLATLRIDPTPTTRPTPTPPPATPSPADAAVAGLVALALNDASTYQVAISGRSRHSADILPIEGTVQVAGADSRIVADITFPEAGGQSRVELRAVAGDGWLQVDSEPWVELGPIGPDEAPNPLAQIGDADDVMILADEPDADGRFQVELEAMVLHPAFIPAVNLSEERVNRTTLTLLIDDRGRPVSATWELVGQGRVSRQLQEIVIELDLTFSGLGGPISISPP